MDDLQPVNRWETLEIGRRGSVVEVTLTRPDLLNRFDEALHREFAAALVEVRGLPEVRAIVLASTGTCFSAGGDTELIRAVHDDTPTRLRIIDQGRQIITSLIDLPVPIVVALQGDAIGLGASVVLVCDIIVAARSARLGDPHVHMGLVAA